ncbi:MAG TPA: UDP-N-acetylmuramoyl-L-alanyl-D-glutamate--2,6-diaminopimelate ligase [Acidimicrobiia bacterium]|nr:UDP-N-acetylmuramoyl-L-alanyl-D-glutamate--2,6-diaminopimelate ligase [Acidimicrobiia bacterium]
MPVRGKKLGDLAIEVGGVIHGDPDVVVTDVTHDSRHVGEGALYIAVRGSHFDGHDFVAGAVAAGSTAVCVDHFTGSGVSELEVVDTRKVMGPLSASVHDDPSATVAVVGVTGTNGKTTVTHYVESITAGAGRTPGLIGTVHTRVGEHALISERTTPEATDFQRLLAEMRDLGADVIAAEISSHALELGRVSATRFAVAAFTNLSQDHLDFHGDMDGYRSAKERLFRDYEVGTAVINVSDPAGMAIASAARMPVFRVGPDADVWAENLSTSFEGTVFDMVVFGERHRVRAPLIGSFNVENALIAAGCCLALGLGVEEVVTGLGLLGAVPGRFELVSGSFPIRVVVDYAHTPEGIKQAITVARGLATGRVIAVFGAGGDRDREKRPLMGRAAIEADLAVLTSDNPRSEDPEAIIREVMSGIVGSAIIVEADRRRAIEHAIRAASPGDVVLILGKGHETGQEIGDRVLPFNDRVVAGEVLARMARSSDPDRDSGRISP